MLGHCTLCPWACGANRAAGHVGKCGSGARPVVYRWGPHFGEEPPLSGTRGAGTVFFSRCTLSCIYCQNWPWSQGGAGEEKTLEDLSGIFSELVERGCHNWDLVSPTPWLPFIRAAVAPLGRRLPFVYNTSGFESVRTLDEFADLVDIALCDLRYARSETASLASGASSYVERSREAMRWFWKNLGPLQVDSDGLARRGTICRLLALPGHVEEACANLRWLAETIGTDVHVSVMSQYTPVYKAKEIAPWNRPLFEEEYETLCIELDELGFDNGWVQDFGEPSPEGLLGQTMKAGEGSAGKPVSSGCFGFQKQTRRGAGKRGYDERT